MAAAVGLFCSRASPVCAALRALGRTETKTVTNKRLQNGSKHAAGKHLLIALTAVRLKLANVVQLGVHALQLRLACRAGSLVFLVQHLLAAQLLQQLSLGLLVPQLHLLNVTFSQRIPLFLSGKFIAQLLLLQPDRLQLRLVLAPKRVDFAQRVLQPRDFVVPLAPLRACY